MITLKDYQEIAIDDLTNKLFNLIQLKSSKKLVFKAPTGSGKTIIVAESLKRLAMERNPCPVAFIWAAPRKLHEQSKEKLEMYYFENKALTCSFFEDLQDKTLNENEILFLNWESINKKDNIYIRDDERDFNLSKVLDNTKSHGVQVVLVIDESHFSVDTTKSQGLIEMINPIVTLDISATPKFIGDDQVTIQREMVIRDEMIKRYIAINQGLKNDVLDYSSDEVRVITDLPENTNDFIIRESS